MLIIPSNVLGSARVKIMELVLSIQMETDVDSYWRSTSAMVKCFLTDVGCMDLNVLFVYLHTKPHTFISHN